MRKCNECIQHILKHKDYLTGVALSGITDGSEDSYMVTNEKLQDVIKTVDVS